MLPRVYDWSRWRSAWYFLSLNTVTSYYPALWVPARHVRDLQCGLRQQLRRYIHLPAYYDEYARVGQALFTWYASEHGEANLRLLQSWVSRVFLSEASDRMDETLWARVINNLSTKGLSERLRVFVDACKSSLAEHNAHFRLELRRTFGATPTRWDAMMDRVEESVRERAGSMVELIGILNAFVRIWNHNQRLLVAGDLHQLYGVGAREASRLPDAFGTLVFPGRWIRKYKDLVRAGFALTGA
jgi:hypothetical protein